MKYKPKEINWSEGFEKCHAIMQENEALLLKIDREAKEKGQLLWRFIKEPVADGCAFYQIIKVNKRTVHIEVCEGLGDDYYIPYWGDRATIELSYAAHNVSRRDQINAFFAERKVKQIAKGDLTN